MAFKVKDYYYNKAKKENFLARSIYKLEEIDKKYKVLSQSSSVLDLGYYPGSWLQYVLSKVNSSASVVGVDIQPINKTLGRHPNLKLFSRDIFTIEALTDLGVETQFDLVLSDMAPSTSGIKFVDQMKSLSLVTKVFDLLPLFLKKGGNFVIKVFDGQEAQDFLKSKKKNFKELHYLRPKSTRSSSKEFFVIGKYYL